MAPVGAVVLGVLEGEARDDVQGSMASRTAIHPWRLVRVSEAPAGTKSRRVFQATNTGRETATRNALVLIAELREVPHPLLVGLANLPLLSEQAYAEALRARLTQVEDRIAAVEEAHQARTPLGLPAREVFSYSLSLLEAERSWLAARVQVPDDRQD